jgi:hypothetical protein
VASFKKFALEPVALDAGRWHMRQQPALWIPRGKDEEHLCIPLLHWLQDNSSSLQEAQKVLHVGSGSGYLTDMIMKGLGGTMASLLCVDHSRWALTATERTVQEHWRLKRSSHVRKRVEMLECESVPSIRTADAKRPPGVKQSKSKPSGIGAANLAAAERRRKLGRAHRSGAVLEQDCKERTASPSAESLLTSSVDLLCVTSAPLSPGSPVWGPFDAMQQEAVLQHSAPYASVGGINMWTAQVLAASQSPLRSGGIVTALLPFSPSSSPKDIIAAQLSAHNGSLAGRGSAWEVLASKRSALCSSVPHAESFLAKRSAHKFLQLCGPQDPIQQHRFRREMVRYLTSGIGSDFVVFGDTAAMQHGSSARFSASQGNRQQPIGEWQDSFEHQHYLPKEGPTNALHWANMIDSFPHLETQQLPLPEAGSTLSPDQRRHLFAARNDASAVLGRSANIVNINAVAEDNLHSIFGHELRSRRQKKAKKLAFASSRNVEWYLDEKVVKSDAARVDVLNEVLKKLGEANPPN